MRQLRQAQAGDQRQQGAIGNGTRIVQRRGLAPKGKRNRLGARAAGQVVHAIPGGHQGDDQERDERHACRHFRRQPPRCHLHGPGAQPVGQQTFGFGGHAPEQRTEPGSASLGQLQHVAKGGDVCVFPRIAAHEAGHYVGNAKQQQRPAGQRADGVLGNDGGGGWSHAAVGGWAKEPPRIKAKPMKKGSPVARAAFLAGSQGRITSLRSCRNGCGSVPRGHPCCPPTFACRCRRGAIQKKYPA